MATDKTPDYLRGLLIPDPRFQFANIDDSASTYTENTPRPGIPAAQQSSDVVLETSGTQEDQTDVRIYAQRPGFPEDRGGSFLWRNAVQTSGLKWQGWEPPHTINGIERVDPAQTGSEYYRSFDAITTQNDTIVMVSQQTGTTGSPVSVWHKTPTATTWTQGQIAADSDLEPDHNIESADFPHAGPALCMLPSGRLLCFFWVYMGIDTSSAPKKKWQIRSHYSDDNGATWELANGFCLNEPLEGFTDTSTDKNYQPGRLRAAYKDGQIILLSSMFDASVDTGQSAPACPANILGQWASSNLGASFELIGHTARTDEHAVGFDVAVSGGNFVVCWIHGHDDVKVARVGTAYQLVTAATSTTLSYPTPGMNKGSGTAEEYTYQWDLSITAAPDSSLYITAVNHWFSSEIDTRHAAVIVASYDRGATWERVASGWNGKNRKTDGTSTPGNPTGFLHLTNMYTRAASGDDSNQTANRDQLREVVGTWYRGRLVLFVRGEKTDGNAQSTNDYAEGIPDKAIHALYCGGYSNLTIGSITTANTLRDRANYAKHWIPLFRPDEYGAGWATTSSGVSTQEILANANSEPYLKLTTGTGSGAAGQRFYEDPTLDDDGVRTTTTSTSGSKTHAEFVVDVVAGGLVSDRSIAVELRNGNPNKAERVSLRFARSGTTADVAIYDEVAGAQLAQKKLNNFTVTMPAEFRVCIHNQKIVVFARSYDADENDRFFNLLYESGAGALALEAVSGKYCEARFGGLSSGGSSTQNESHWYKFQAGSHDGDSVDCGVPRLADWFDYTSPRDVAGRFFSSSPLYVEHGVKVAAKDGPAHKAEEWQIETRHDYPVESMHHELQPSPARPWRSKDTTANAAITWKIDDAAAALPLGTSYGLYLGNCNFRFATLEAYDGSSWTTIADIDTATECAFIRKGNTFAPDPGSTNAPQTSPHFITYGSLAGYTFNAAHGAGVTPKPFSIDQNSEGVFSASATRRAKIIVAGDTSAAGASGTGAIWSRDLVVLFHGAENLAYEKIRLTIPSSGTGSTPNTTADGYWQIGIAIWGHLAAFGRQYSRGHIRGMETNAEIFTNKGGKRRAVRYGPPRRTVEFSWSDPVDVSQMQGTTPTPDYVKGYNNGSAGIVATVADAPWLLQGLISTLDGPVVPVVYLPSIPTNAETNQILDPNRMLYGRIVSSSVRIENELGSEWLGTDAGEVVTATAIRIDEEV